MRQRRGGVRPHRRRTRHESPACQQINRHANTEADIRAISAVPVGDHLRTCPEPCLWCPKGLGWSRQAFGRIQIGRTKES